MTAALTQSRRAEEETMETTDEDEGWNEENHSESKIKKWTELWLFLPPGL